MFFKKCGTKYITPISKNECIDKLADAVNEYNNTYCRTIKIEPVDDFGVENYDTDLRVLDF